MRSRHQLSSDRYRWRGPCTGDTDIGNHCIDCTTTITLPFSFRLYDRTFTSANVSSNGNLQFVSNDPSPDNVCLPYAPFEYAILPHWDQLYTFRPGKGIHINQWKRTQPHLQYRVADLSERAGSRTADFEVRLYENSSEHRLM